MHPALYPPFSSYNYSDISLVQEQKCNCGLFAHLLGLNLWSVCHLAKPMTTTQKQLSDLALGPQVYLLCKDTMNCAEKAMKISHLNPNQSAPSIYIMIELCYFSLDQWEIRLHLLWGTSFNISHCCDPHLNQTKFNDLLPLTIPGVLGSTFNIDILRLLRNKVK